MCAPLLVAAAIGTQVAAGGYSAYSQYQQGVAQKKYYNAMADQSNLEGEAKLAVAQKQSELVQDQAAQQGKQASIKGAQLNATQVADEAANGVTGVTAQDIASDTFSKQKQDEIAMRYNADTKSWDIMTQGNYDKFAADQQDNQYRVAGANAKAAGKIAMTGTILSTAASVASTAMMAGMKLPTNTQGVRLPTSEGVMG